MRQQAGEVALGQIAPSAQLSASCSPPPSIRAQDFSPSLRADQDHRYMDSQVLKGTNEGPGLECLPVHLSP
jgi:hypothetical protein